MWLAEGLSPGFRRGESGPRSLRDDGALLLGQGGIQMQQERLDVGDARSAAAWRAAAWRAGPRSAAARSADAGSAAEWSAAVYFACKPDVAEFCGKVRPGGGRLRSCLMERSSKLSPGCNQALIQPQKQQ